MGSACDIFYFVQCMIQKNMALYNNANHILYYHMNGIVLLYWNIALLQGMIVWLSNVGSELHCCTLLI